MTDIILQRGKCVYWGCLTPTQGIYCREHRPTRCRVCNCEPYGSRGLTYGMCQKHYKYWARHHSPQRAKILEGDRRRGQRRAEARKAAQRLKKAAQTWEIPWEPASESERQRMGGWDSGACTATERLVLVQ